MQRRIGTSMHSLVRTPDGRDADHRLPGQRMRLRVRVPLRKTAHGGHHQTHISGGLLKGFGRPVAQRGGDGSTLGGRPGGQAQQPQRAIAVVGKVGMQAHKARLANGRTAGVQARQLVPHIGHLAVDGKVRRALQRSVDTVNR